MSNGQSHMDTADALASRTTTSEVPAKLTIDSLLVDDEENYHNQANTADAQSFKVFKFPTELTDDERSSPGQSKRPTPKYEFGDWNWNFVFLHDNVHIVSGSRDGTMRKWDCETGLLVGEPWEGQGGAIYSLALSPDGKTIACGGKDGSVEMWNTDGEMIERIWTSHSYWVRSLSWSPSGDHIHIAIGSHDGKLLIRNVESGEVEVGPIETNQRWVLSAAYSPSGDRIASAGDYSICIWDSRTGDLLVGPIEDLGNLETWVRSVVWSLDGTKLYSADTFVRVFDSIKGTELLRLQHHKPPRCVALSPKHNLLACVGYEGIAQLWNTESNQPLGHPFHHERQLYCVSFSPDGWYLACGGGDNKITLWIMKDIAPEIESPSPSCFEVDATKPFTGAEDQRDNIYQSFFRSSGPSYPSAVYGSSPPSHRPHLFSRHLWNTLIPARHHRAASESSELQERPKRRFFGQQAGPQPVTVSAGRRKEMNVHARSVVPKKKHINAQSTIYSAKPSSPMQSPSTSQMPQHPQSQPVTQPAQDEYDFGRWGNFWHAICCIQPRPHQTVSAVQSAGS